MPTTSDPALSLSRVRLQLLIGLNLVVGAGFFVLLAASFVFESAFVGYYRTHIPAADTALLIPTLRAMVLLGAPMFAAIHVLLTRILDIVETVRHGRAFVVENAVRLRTIAWALLLLQVLHLGFGVAVRFVNTANVEMEWDFSLTGWQAVLLSFVLARVFEEGARMRDDLEAMI